MTATTTTFATWTRNNETKEHKTNCGRFRIVKVCKYFSLFDGACRVVKKATLSTCKEQVEAILLHEALTSLEPEPTYALNDRVWCGEIASQSAPSKGELRALRKALRFVGVQFPTSGAFTVYDSCSGSRNVSAQEIRDRGREWAHLLSAVAISA